MWSKVVISIVLGILAHGCAAHVEEESKYPKPLSPEFVMHGDKSFSESERKQIEASAGVWREQTGGQANLKIVWDWSPTLIPNGDHYIERLGNNDLEVILTDCEISAANDLPPCTPTVLARVEPSGGIHNPDHDPVHMKFIPGRYPSAEYFISVAIHEMGHVFGLPHQSAPQAVMYPSQNAIKTCLKPSDLAAFCQYNVCDDRKMSPCE